MKLKLFFITSLFTVVALTTAVFYVMVPYFSEFNVIFSLLIMCMTVGVTLFFKQKIVSFLENVFATPLERYANRSI